MTTTGLRNKVVSQLVWDTRVDAKDIDVEVDNGKVFLQGTVPTTSAQIAAVEDALNVEGVNEVESDMEVDLAEAHVFTDAEITSKVENKLAWNPDITVFDIDVTVDNYWVTLEGTVDALWKKFLVEKEVKDVIGVVGVTNKVVIAPDKDIADKVIAQGIMDAIDRDARVQPDTVNVEVEDGTVTLTGTVYRYAAKNAAWNAAIRTAGATRVINNIIVNTT